MRSPNARSPGEDERYQIEDKRLSTDISAMLNALSIADVASSHEHGGDAWKPQSQHQFFGDRVRPPPQHANTYNMGSDRDTFNAAGSQYYDDDTAAVRPASQLGGDGDAVGYSDNVANDSDNEGNVDNENLAETWVSQPIATFDEEAHVAHDDSDHLHHAVDDIGHGTSVRSRSSNSRNSVDRAVDRGSANSHQQRSDPYFPLAWIGGGGGSEDHVDDLYDRARHQTRNSTTSNSQRIYKSKDVAAATRSTRILRGRQPQRPKSAVRSVLFDAPGDRDRDDNVMEGNLADVHIDNNVDYDEDNINWPHRQGASRPAFLNHMGPGPVRNERNNVAHARGSRGRPDEVPVLTSLLRDDDGEAKSGAHSGGIGRGNGAGDNGRGQRYRANGDALNNHTPANESSPPRRRNTRSASKSKSPSRSTTLSKSPPKIGRSSPAKGRSRSRSRSGSMSPSKRQRDVENRPAWVPAAQLSGLPQQSLSDAMAAGRRCQLLRAKMRPRRAQLSLNARRSLSPNRRSPTQQTHVSPPGDNNEYSSRFNDDSDRQQQEDEDQQRLPHNDVLDGDTAVSRLVDTVDAVLIAAESDLEAVNKESSVYQPGDQPVTNDVRASHADMTSSSRVDGEQVAAAAKEDHQAAVLSDQTSGDDDADGNNVPNDGTALDLLDGDAVNDGGGKGKRTLKSRKSKKCSATTTDGTRRPISAPVGRSTSVRRTRKNVQGDDDSTRHKVKTKKVPANFVPAAAMPSAARKLTPAIDDLDYGRNWRHNMSPRTYFKVKGTRTPFETHRVQHRKHFFIGRNAEGAWDRAGAGGDNSAAVALEKKLIEVREKASWAALLKGEGPLTVIVARCRDCANHLGTVHHDESKYDAKMASLRADIECELRPEHNIVVREHMGITPLGAFEVLLQFRNFDVEPQILGLGVSSATAQDLSKRMRSGHSVSSMNHVTLFSKLHAKAFPDIPKLVVHMLEILNIRKANRSGAQYEIPGGSNDYLNAGMMPFNGHGDIGVNTAQGNAAAAAGGGGDGDGGGGVHDVQGSPGHENASHEVTAITAATADATADAMDGQADTLLSFGKAAPGRTTPDRVSPTSTTAIADVASPGVAAGISGDGGVPIQPDDPLIRPLSPYSPSQHGSQQPQLQESQLAALALAKAAPLPASAVTSAAGTPLASYRSITSLASAPSEIPSENTPRTTGRARDVQQDQSVLATALAVPLPPSAAGSVVTTPAHTARSLASEHESVDTVQHQSHTTTHSPVATGGSPAAAAASVDQNAATSADLSAHHDAVSNATPTAVAMGNPNAATAET